MSGLGYLSTGLDGSTALDGRTGMVFALLALSPRESNPEFHGLEPVLITAPPRMHVSDLIHADYITGGDCLSNTSFRDIRLIGIRKKECQKVP